MRINGWTPQHDKKSESAHPALPAVEAAMAFTGMMQKKKL